MSYEFWQLIAAKLQRLSFRVWKCEVLHFHGLRCYSVSVGEGPDCIWRDLLVCAKEDDVLVWAQQ